MTAYYRVRLGQGGVYTSDAVAGGYIGLNYDTPVDLGAFAEESSAFSAALRPIYLDCHPDTTAVAAGLSVGMLWSLAKSMQVGDVILSPGTDNRFRVGRIVGGYSYVPGADLPHRRPVEWLSETLSTDQLSPSLWASIRTPLAVVNASPHAIEIEKLLSGHAAAVITVTDPEIEDVHAFALEKHLEEFLVANWENTELGRTHRIYEVDGQRVGQQFPTATGPIDILAVSNDGSELLVVELKRGRASDAVVGQIQRYMGYVKSELAAPGQRVRGAIIALEDDPRVRYALAVAPDIAFFRYAVSFQLSKVAI
ncbi:endonuclease NucS domain-containing protein [Pimelobacter simplex]|uniref:endonuclease NucS domain-containing protein n=1 Tax=Nocardioides simplex TaxID=2045 RepID=UPI00366E0CB7